MPVELNDFDDERLIEIRKSQEDPIVQYYIVRSDVGMSAGKIGAQIAHGAQMFVFRYLEKKEQGSLDDKQGKLIEDWLAGSFRKVVLSGTAGDFEKLKKELDVFLVRDAGLTEVSSGTETVLVTYPMLKSERPKFLKRLRVLENVK